MYVTVRYFTYFTALSQHLAVGNEDIGAYRLWCRSADYSTMTFSVWRYKGEGKVVSVLN